MNDKYADRKQIIVVGYPKSGNTWLSRLLGEVLNSPVTGAYHAKPLATEGLDRQGDYVVRQLHLQPVDSSEPPAVASAWAFRYKARQDERMIHVVRDPRDVAVSIAHYWNRPSVEDALDLMIAGEHPLRAHGPWARYVTAWLDCPTYLRTIRYEDLHRDTDGTLWMALRAAGVGDDAMPDDARIRQAIRAQAIDAKRAQIKIDGDERPHGKAIQLHNLRRGVVGDWRDQFTPEMEERAWDAWGDVMGRLGYER